MGWFWPGGASRERAEDRVKGGEGFARWEWVVGMMGGEDWLA
jgi:hypothetical protein